MSSANVRNFTGRATVEHKAPVWLELLDKAEAGTLSKEEKLRIGAGLQKSMGWEYNFRSYMNKYVVKTAYYLEETYAFDKTGARAQFAGLGKVHYIVEAPNPYRR